jgi:hypothetical protein
LLVAVASEGDAAAGVVVEAVAEAVLVEAVGVGGEVAVLLALREGAGEVEAAIDSTANDYCSDYSIQLYFGVYYDMPVLFCYCCCAHAFVSSVMTTSTTDSVHEVSHQS